MSRNTSPAESPRGERKPFSKHKWRGKLFSTEGKFGNSVESLGSTDDDVANFLQGATIKPEERSHLGEPSTPKGYVAEIKRRPVPSPRPEIVDTYRRPKPRQNKGLRVAFATATPEIIGEGGDEAELPAGEVSKSYLPSVGSLSSNAERPVVAYGNESPQESQEPWGPSKAEDDPLIRPLSLQRRPTGLEDYPLENNIGLQDHDAGPYGSNYYVSSAKDPKRLPEPPSQRHDHCRSRETPPDIVPSNSASTWAQPQQPSDHQKTSSLNYAYTSTAPVSRGPSNHVNSDPNITHQAAQETPAAPNPKPLSFQNVAEGLGDDSLEDFDSRVRRFNDLFHLGMSAHIDVMKVTFVQWIRIATWWFLQGRGGLESAVRGRSSGKDRSSPEPQGGAATALEQAYVDLAKAWWIVRRTTSNHPEVRRFGKHVMGSLVPVIKNSGDIELTELVETHQSVMSSLRALTMSMKRNGRLPPYDLEIRGLDVRTLLKFPVLSPEIAKLVVNNVSGAHVKNGWFVTEPFFPMLVKDTERHFSFGRMFVEASLDSRDGAKQIMHMPCLVSVLRERDDWGVKAAVASQDGQVNIVIQSSGHGPLTWRDVHWNVASHMMLIRLYEGFELKIFFSQIDFRSLWGIYDYTQRMQKEYSPGKDERIIFECELDRFQCDDQPDFPSNPIPDCRLRLFEKRAVISDDSGQRRLHGGYRLTVITPPHVKTLSGVNYPLGRDTPILFSYQQDKEGSRLILKGPMSVRLSLGFHEIQDQEAFRSLLCGTSLAQEDHVYRSLLLRDLNIKCTPTAQILIPQDADASGNTIQCRKLRVVNRGPPPPGHESLPTVRAEHLRILVECDYGTLTDRINLGPGELQINLSVENFKEITLLRPAQPDITWSLVDGKVPKEEFDSVCQMLQKLATSMSVRRYFFHSISDLHSFQTMVTGFKVLFDGPASNFAIARRRTVLPIHKQWEATSTRLQVVKQDKVVQLTAFFKDFPHGACMNFVLKVTDVFESFSKSAIFFLRIVDAKFATPRAEEGRTRDFVCLDMPEYPGEHDDIIIGFDIERDRDKFGEALPAPVSKTSRMVSLRR